MPIDMFLTPHSTDPMTPEDHRSQTMKRIYDEFQLFNQILERVRSQQKQQYDKRTKNLD